MTIRLCLDEDSMDGDLVRALRGRSVDVITALDAGMIDRPDADHLDYATAHGRVLCTFNTGDFYRLHGEYAGENKSHAGIILARQQHYTVGEQMRRLLRLLAAKSEDSMRNQVEFLSHW